MISRSCASLPGRLGTVVLAALLFVACSDDAGAPGATGTPTARPRGNVLLIVVDTLRADKLGCYGNERGLTPRLDQLAEQSVLFEHASSHAPWTLPSTASLLTSLYPRQHGAGGRVPDFTALAPKVETLAQRFRAAGARTGTIANVLFLGRKFGLARGFEHVDVESYEDNRRMRPAQATTDTALEWLDQGADEPFFLLVHYFDPHAVYDPPQPFRRRFAEARDRETEFSFGTREQMVGLRTGAFEPGPALVRRAEALYDGEVAYTDEHVGRLIEGLAARGLADSTLVVLTSDHGEEFRDHGGLEHGHSLYSELLHVPLLLRIPGTAAERIGAGVGQVDVAPTLCAWAGIAPGEDYVGTSLLELVGVAESADRDVLAHGNFWGPPLTSWRTDDRKLILSPQGGAQLFGWKTDSREQHDLAAREPGRVTALREQLGERERLLKSGGRPVPVELSEERLRGLEALGYTEGPPGDQRDGDRDQD